MYLLSSLISACADSFLTPNIDVFPLSDLRPGMQGEVFTVVKGAGAGFLSGRK